MTQEYLDNLSEQGKVEFYINKVEQILESQSFRYDNFPCYYELPDKEPVLPECPDYSKVDTADFTDKILTYTLFFKVQSLIFETRENYLELLITSENEIVGKKPYPRLLRNNLISRLKRLTTVDTSEKKLPQAGIMYISYRNRKYLTKILFLPHSSGDNLFIISEELL